MKKILEKDIQRACLDLLRLKGYFVWKQPNAGIMRGDGKGYIPSQMPGLADIIGLSKKGRFMAIEVKRPGNKPSPTQEEFLSNIAGSKGFACVVTSVDELLEFLKQIDG